ncbi:hypothetical protein RvY_03940 [Ramazzottius varieornatus]|uniref:Carboxylic ester hydrolase n=1 Tax=Ramazzottius varieornatus TaxID=947166 RepID=A0A1D1UT99_RAMVA|nr:hypothetical protein RvY_03940 [Ramazzottius varieornatus]
MVAGWNIMFCLAVTLAFVTAENDSGKGVVKLSSGAELHGEQSQEGGTTAFYGIKYGTAGRFEHAKPNTDFAYLKDPNRVKQGYVCPHFPMNIPGFPTRKLDMNEDCLYLDVYVPPSDKEKAEARPVFFWIYGGGFKMGDKDMYNATILAKAIDAVVVTVNYRLSVFGFLSTGDEAAPGNWAISDLKVALNWTLDNIAAFGGDPKKITISGESAGGALTSALMLDDDVRHKVKAGIAFSGSILSGWAVVKDPKAIALTLAASLGCSNATTAEAVACLKGMQYEVLLNGTKALEDKTDKAQMGMHFTPVVDGSHIAKLPADILLERAAKEDKSSEENAGKLITGYLREDAAMFTLFIAPQALLDNATHNYSSALKMLTMHSIGMTKGKCPPDVVAKNAKAAFDFYKISESVTSDEALNAYHMIASDLMFGVSAMKESMMYANISEKANQMFLITFNPGFRRLGAFHFMEVLHLFRGVLDAMMKEKMSEAFTKTISDYVHQIVYNGHYDGPFFGREGNYQEIDQDSKVVNKKIEFAKTQLLEDMLHCRNT